MSKVAPSPTLSNQAAYSVRRVSNTNIKYVVQTSLMDQPSVASTTAAAAAASRTGSAPSFQDELQAMWNAGVVSVNERRWLLSLYRVSLAASMFTCTMYGVAGVLRMADADLGRDGAVLCSLAGTLFVVMFSAQLIAMVVRCRMAMQLRKRAAVLLFATTTIACGVVSAALHPAHLDTDRVCTFPNLQPALRAVLAVVIVVPFVEVLRRLMPLRRTNPMIRLLAASSSYSLFGFVMTLALNGVGGSAARQVVASIAISDGLLSAGVAARIFWLQWRASIDDKVASTSAVYPAPHDRIAEE